MDNTKQHRLSPAFIAAVFVFSLLAAMAAGVLRLQPSDKA